MSDKAFRDTPEAPSESEAIKIFTECIHSLGLEFIKIEPDGLAYPDIVGRSDHQDGIKALYFRSRNGTDIDTSANQIALDLIASFAITPLPEGYSFEIIPGSRWIAISLYS